MSEASTHDAPKKPVTRGLRNTIDTGRIPVVLPVTVRLIQPGGASCDGESYLGSTRDVSASGLGIYIHHLPHAAIEQLNVQGAKVVLEVDFHIKGKTVQTLGEKVWLNVDAKKSDSCLVGVEYTNVDSEITDLILQHAQRVHHRPKVIKAAIATLIPIVALSALLYWQLQESKFEKIAQVEYDLQHAIGLKQQSLIKLEVIEDEVQVLRNSANTTAGVLIEKIKQLQDTRKQFETMRDKVGKISAKFAAFEAQPPEGLGKRAVYHLDRGQYFSTKNNLAAALVEYELAVALDATLSRGYLEIAIINDLYGRRAEAVAGFERYLQLQPHALDAVEIRQNIQELNQELHNPEDTEAEQLDAQ